MNSPQILWVFTLLQNNNIQNRWINIHTAVLTSGETFSMMGCWFQFFLACFCFCSPQPTWSSVWYKAFLNVKFLFCFSVVAAKGSLFLTRRPGALWGHLSQGDLHHTDVLGRVVIQLGSIVPAHLCDECNAISYHAVQGSLQGKHFSITQIPEVWTLCEAQLKQNVIMYLSCSQ